VVKPTPPGGPDFDLKVNDTFSDLLIGARYIAPLDDHWRLMVTGDVSGGDTDGTWTAGVFGSYLKGAHRYILGYRHLEVDVKANGTEADETMSGPIVAYGYQF
jgi:hypothetical protein